MKAFMIRDAGDSFMTDVPEPQLENDLSVKVQVESVGICGTDIKIFEGHHSQSVGQDRIPGHEFAGVVTDVGKKVTSIKVGDRVVHEPINYCGKCYACRRGEVNVCKDLHVTGCNMSGGLEEYFVANEKQWHKIPDSITWNEAACIEPYTIAGHACARAEVTPGDFVMIYGAGPIGLAIADISMNAGAAVAISEISEGRIAIAKQMGIPYVVDSKSENFKDAVMQFTGGEGPNIVFECAGFKEFAEEGVQILSPAGRFVPLAPVTFACDAYWMTRRQVRLVTARLQVGQFPRIIENFEKYRRNIDIMVTDTFDFNDSKAAFEFACERHPQTGKVVIRFGKN